MYDDNRVTNLHLKRGLIVAQHGVAQLDMYLGAQITRRVRQ